MTREFPPFGSNAFPSDSVSGEFSGKNSDFRRLVTHGAIMELLTFGFYRFWLATNIRRHLWSHTSVAGDSFEYTGKARELLIGFLVALAILVPIYIANFVAGIEAERLKAFLSLPLALLFYGFWQFANYRARRYRVSHTVWRGVRFWMTVSGITYALKSFGWSLLTGLTFGLAYPRRAAALERYKMGHTFYGNLAGGFEGKGFELFKRGLWLWLSAVLLLAGVIALSVVARKTPLAGILPFVLLVLYVFGYAAFKAIEWKWWVQGLRLGDVGFDSSLKTAPLWQICGN